VNIGRQFYVPQLQHYPMLLLAYYYSNSVPVLSA